MASAAVLVIFTDMVLVARPMPVNELELIAGGSEEEIELRFEVLAVQLVSC